MKDEFAKEMATFCYVLKISPAEYRSLTLRERNAFVEVVEEMNNKRE